MSNVSVAATFVAKSVDQRTIKVYVSIAVTGGTYVTGGPTLDLSSVIGPNNGIAVAKILPPTLLQDSSGFQYRYNKGSAANFSNGTLQMFGQYPTSSASGVIALTERANGDTVASGTIDAVFTFQREA